jgi:hypothetical protein
MPTHHMRCFVSIVGWSVMIEEERYDGARDGRRVLLKGSQPLLSNIPVLIIYTIPCKDVAIPLFVIHKQNFSQLTRILVVSPSNWVHPLSQVYGAPPPKAD